MGTPQPLVPLRWLTEAIAERDRLEALNAELLGELKLARQAILDGAQEYGLPRIEVAIAKAEGRK